MASLYSKSHRDIIQNFEINFLSLCPYWASHEKKLLTIEELNDRKRQVAERLVKKFVDSGLGLMYQNPEFDKYTYDKEADVDCESRLDTCKAVCCKLPFALSKHDVEEGIIRWEFFDTANRFIHTLNHFA